MEVCRGNTYTTTCVEARRQLGGLVPSFYHVSPRDLTQDISCKCLYPLSNLARPKLGFKKPHVKCFEKMEK